MKGLSTLVAFVGLANAHSIFQKVSVNGVDQGQLKGVRAPRSNNPIENVNHPDFACNTNLQYKDNNVITVPAGARVGAWWGHEIGGASGPSDPDHPIAASHKGPVIAYLAKVDNAATTGTTGLKWFKVAEDGLSGTTWAVDTLIANNGWHYFTMPTCIAPGDYLMRVEIIALHNAYTYPGAQFYMECAQIRITGSGSTVGSDTVSFPGAYQSNHPGITISIYDQTGRPLNGGRPYQIPGPKVLTCPSNGGGNPGNPTNPPATTMTTSVIPAPTQAPGGAPLWGQCGGQGWTGPTTCASGTCKETNQWYSQCQP